MSLAKKYFNQHFIEFNSQGEFVDSGLVSGDTIEEVSGKMLAEGFESDPTCSPVSVWRRVGGSVRIITADATHGIGTNLFWAFRHAATLGFCKAKQ